MDFGQLINYLHEVEAATPENARYLLDQFYTMNQQFQQIERHLQQRLPRRRTTLDVEEQVRNFIGQGFSPISTEVSLEFIQELFRQVSSIKTYITVSKFQRYCTQISKFFNDETFEKVAPENRMRLLTLMRRFLYGMCYGKRIKFFEGLAFSIHSGKASEEPFLSRVQDLRRQGYNDNDIEIMISLEYNSNITYIEFPKRSNSHYARLWMSRLIAFSNVNENIVIIGLETFWQFNVQFVTQEELNALPMTQKFDIPDASKQVILDRGLVI